jgi:hypothetical protein
MPAASAHAAGSSSPCLRLGAGCFHMAAVVDMLCVHSMGGWDQKQEQRQRQCAFAQPIDQIAESSSTSIPYELRDPAPDVDQSKDNGA